MSKELELSGKTPLTKSEIEDLSVELLNPVLEGEVDPVSHVVKLKAMQETIKRTLDDDRMKDAVLSEIENIVTVILKQNLDDIFSDVVNIALYGCKDDRSLRPLQLQ